MWKIGALRYGTIMYSVSEPNGDIESLHLVKSIIIFVSESVMPESDFSHLINIVSWYIFSFEVGGVFGN